MAGKPKDKEKNLLPFILRVANIEELNSETSSNKSGSNSESTVKILN